MGLAQIVEGLRNQACKHRATYEAARHSHEALASYAGVGVLFDAIALSSPLPAEPRNAITLALIAEEQKKAHPLWQALLLHAYEPMLKKLRARIRVEDDDEADQRVLLAFIEAVRRLPRLEDPLSVSGYLRVATERAVFRTVQEDRSEPETESFDEETYEPSSWPGNVEDQMIARIDLKSALQSEPNARELADVLYATIGEGESLHDYVRRTHADATAPEQETIYTRLQKQRHRLLGRLRAKLD